MTVVSDLFNAGTGILEALMHNVIGLGILALVGFFIYLKFFKPVPLDMGKEVFNKLWDATTEILRLSSPKEIGLCSYPMTAEEISKSPIHHIQHQNIGNCIGINAIGILNDVESLQNLKRFTEEFNEDNYKRLLSRIKESGNIDKFWLVFAVKNIVGTTFLFFPKYKKTLIFVKPKQIINVSKFDHVIRVRGFGVTPLGEYQLINDEDVNINRQQLLSDTVENINQELLLGAWARMGEIVQNAMQSDSTYRKETAIEGIKVLSTPEKQEGGTQ